MFLESERSRERLGASRTFESNSKVSVKRQEGERMVRTLNEESEQEKSRSVSTRTNEEEEQSTLIREMFGNEMSRRSGGDLEVSGTAGEHTRIPEQSLSIARDERGENENLTLRAK